ncbi:LacI family DNA-binding transcriptional regulator [Corynebacterium sp. TAE3-ERU2]|uniref:LacI family DNA-binding transcriptional regulator n=1 Tax=Corynebacterium sp. TAE3-ERU2 TaxID=2849497 RepID=UPI001C4884D7|nr:LacI family DNA-binding transcriptional regulator [Corynebacterium sp. TAE3-ERU2]MBV7302407.1 LacI family transcriptional regulator [Corynebacterium sp. TAE3-ERU2]
MAGATLKDIAAATGLSVSTVSRALAGSSAISTATNKRVREAATKLKYRPNSQARALKGSKTDTIGLITPGVGNPYFSVLASAIEEKAAQFGLSLIMANSNDNTEQLIRSLEIMENQRIDGLIVVPHIGSGERIAALQRSGTPVVAVDRQLALPDSEESFKNAIPFVDSDPTPGITAAVELLVRVTDEIGYLAGPQDTSTGVLRKRAFLSACSKHNVTPVLYQGGYAEKEGFDGARSLVERGVRAVIAGDSMMTLGALRFCHHSRLRLGHDIALVGFDDFPVFELQEVPMTIIDQDVCRMGRTAFKTLQNLIASSCNSSANNNSLNTLQGTSLPTRLIVRDSTTLERR